MAVDYRKQYKPEQLTPFWPDEVMHLVVASLCALAVITFLAVLPVILQSVGLEYWVEESEPADPRATPADIRPEWYFLAVYQWLKLPPTELAGISGKTIGVLSLGVIGLAVLLLPFWARFGSQRRPGILHYLIVTLLVAIFVLFTLWAVWPAPAPMLLKFLVVTLLFYVLLAGERRRIRRILQRR